MLVYSWQGRVVLFQWPFVQRTLGHSHYEWTLLFTLALKEVWSFYLLIHMMYIEHLGLLKINLNGFEAINKLHYMLYIVSPHVSCHQHYM